MNYTRGFSFFNKFLLPTPSFYSKTTNRCGLRDLNYGFSQKTVSKFQSSFNRSNLSRISISSGILNCARFCSASPISSPNESQIPLSWPPEFNLIRDQQPPLQQVTTVKLDDKLDKSLEINDPKVIFDSIWRDLEKKYGRANLRFPREIILLMGAPGSGKSYNAPYIRKARDIAAPELVMSSLLNSPEAQDIKKTGELVPDSAVVRLFLEKLLEEKFNGGVVVDGFPRTKTQVECLKFLQTKMYELHKEFKGTSESFKRPVFRVAVLFVDETESIIRQSKRGKEARDHNIHVQQTGRGVKVEERSTDFDDEKARYRYRVFKEHYGTLQQLHKIFPFSIINTMAHPDVVKQEIANEFKYQSSLELTEETFKQVSRIPLASEIVSQSRQTLVSRLDNYQSKYSELFKKVIQILQERFIPQVSAHPLSGVTVIKTTDSFFDDPIVVNMVLDVMAERGFTITTDIINETVPTRVDLTTGLITNTTNRTRLFKITYKKAILRQTFDI